MLLRESILVKPIVEEKDISKLPEAVLHRVTYPICNIGEKNANKRVYEKDVWDKVQADETLQEMMDQRRLFGHAEHPEETQSNLEKTSHCIHKMWIDESDNTVYQTLDVVNTPMGRIVDALLRADCMVGVSTRAEGDLEEAEDDEGAYSRVIPESYRYVTTDFTADPSTFGAIPLDARKSVVSSIQSEMTNDKADADDKRFARKLLESMNCKDKVEEDAELSFTPEEQKVVNQIRKEYSGLGKRYDFWIGEKPDGGLTWEGGVELGMDQEFRNTYSLLPTGEIIKNKFSKDEKKKCQGCGRCKVLEENKEQDEVKPEERTIASLVEEGQLRESNKATMDGNECMLTIKEGFIGITVDGKQITLDGAEVASVYPDGVIHVWAKEETLPAPVIVEPGPPQEEVDQMDAAGPLPVVDEIPPEERDEVPESKLPEGDAAKRSRRLQITYTTDSERALVNSTVNKYQESAGITKFAEETLVDARPELIGELIKDLESLQKDNPGITFESKEKTDEGVDQLVAQIDELKAKIESEGATPEMEHQLKELETEVSKAGGEIPEGRIPVEGGVSDKLAAGNLLRKGLDEFWTVKEVGGEGLLVTRIGEPGTEQLISWDKLPEHDFIKVGEKIVEKVSVVVKEHEGGWAVALTGGGPERILTKYTKEEKDTAINQGKQVAGESGLEFKVIGETKEEAVSESTYEVTWVESGHTKHMTELEARKEFGKDEWEEVKQGHLPHIVAVQIGEKKVEEKLSADDVKRLFTSIDPMFAKHLSGLYGTKMLVVTAGQEVGLELSAEGEKAIEESEVKEDFEAFEGKAIELGDTVQIMDFEGNTTVVPHAIVHRLDTIEPEGIVAIEVTGSENEDEMQWYNEGEHQIVLLKKASESVDFNGSSDFIEIADTSTSEAIKALKIKEATTRAECETAIETVNELSETVDNLKNEDASNQHKLRMLASKIKKESIKNQNSLEELATKVKEAERVYVEVDALRAKLEEKAKLAATIQAALEEIKESSDKNIFDLKESVTKQEKEVESLSEKYIGEVAEAREQGEKDGSTKVVNEYVACKLAELGISIGENTRALLDECMSLREVDDILEKVMDIMRRSALHSGTITEVHIETQSVDPEQSKIDEDVRSACQGMNGG